MLSGLVLLSHDFSLLVCRHVDDDQQDDDDRPAYVVGKLRMRHPELLLCPFSHYYPVLHLSHSPLPSHWRSVISLPQRLHIHLLTSGWGDLNTRPLVPQTSVLTKLNYIPVTLCGLSTSSPS